MTEPHDDDALRQLVQLLDPGSTLVRTWPLAGGVSARVTAFEIEQPDGQRTTLVLRQHGEADCGRNANIARDEFRLLRIVRSHGVTAPEPIFLDESGELFATPIVAIEYVDGETEFAPSDVTDFIAQMVSQLVMIHGVPDSPGLTFLPRRGQGFGARPEHLDVALGEGRIRDVLESVATVAQVNDSVLFHGD